MNATTLYVADHREVARSIERQARHPISAGSGRSSMTWTTPLEAAMVVLITRTPPTVGQVVGRPAHRTIDAAA